MLTIIGRPYPDIDTSKDILVHPSEEFDLNFDFDLLNEPWSREVLTDIQGIDFSDVNQGVEDILLKYGMHPEDLATGTKNLLMFKYLYDGRKCRLAMMGENCYKYLMDIADEKDVCAVATVFLMFREADLKGRSVYFPDVNLCVNTEKQFLEAMSQLDDTGVFHYAT